LGCVLYELIALNPPFTAKDMKGLYHRVMKGVYPKIPNHYSNDLNQILKGMLQIDPKKRPTCKEILEMP
jgi:NIMA (never in mitosis gene a)-related kinase 1/4/5